MKISIRRRFFLDDPKHRDVETLWPLNDERSNIEREKSEVWERERTTIVQQIERDGTRLGRDWSKCKHVSPIIQINCDREEIDMTLRRDWDDIEMILRSEIWDDIGMRKWLRKWEGKTLYQLWCWCLQRYVIVKQFRLTVDTLINWPNGDLPKITTTIINQQHTHNHISLSL